MIETAAIYVIVAGAGAWVLWSILLPARARQAIRATVRPGAKRGSGGCENCDCG